MVELQAIVLVWGLAGAGTGEPGWDVVGELERHERSLYSSI
jgi:hypothetical protein